MLQEVSKAIESGELALIEGLVLDALNAGDHPNAILLEDMIPAICVVGAKFQAKAISVREARASAMTMKLGIEVLQPFLSRQAAGKYGTYIFGTAAGDRAVIGRDTARLMIEIAGLEVIELDVVVIAEEFAEEIKANPDYKVVGTVTIQAASTDTAQNNVRVLVTTGRMGQTARLADCCRNDEGVCRHDNSAIYMTPA